MLVSSEQTEYSAFYSTEAFVSYSYPKLVAYGCDTTKLQAIGPVCLNIEPNHRVAHGIKNAKVFACLGVVSNQTKAKFSCGISYNYTTLVATRTESPFAEETISCIQAPFVSFDFPNPTCLSPLQVQTSQGSRSVTTIVLAYLSLPK